MGLRDLWTKLDDASRQAFFRTAMWIAIIVGTVYTIGQSGLVQNNAPLAVKIDAPKKITFPKSNAVVNFPVTVQLTNNTTETALLEAPNPCKIIRWYITTEQGDFVQAPVEEACSQVVMNANLPAGQIARDEFEVPLATDRYQPGMRYQLMLRFWGQDGDHAFEIELE